MMWRKNAHNKWTNENTWDVTCIRCDVKTHECSHDPEWTDSLSFQATLGGRIFSCYKNAFIKGSTFFKNGTKSVRFIVARLLASNHLHSNFYRNCMGFANRLPWNKWVFSTYIFYRFLWKTTQIIWFSVIAKICNRKWIGCCSMCASFAIFMSVLNGIRTYFFLSGCWSTQANEQINKQRAQQRTFCCERRRFHFE